MKPIDLASVQFQIESLLIEDVPAFFTQVEGEIFCYYGDDTPVHAGRIECYLIDVEQAEARDVAPADLFDQMEEAYECYELLFDPESDEIRDEFMDAFGVAETRNILMLHHLEVLSAFRGHSIGLAAMSRAIDLFGQGCGYVVLKVAPLQFASRDYSLEANWYEKYGLAQFTADKVAAGQKLQDYYARLGFRSIPEKQWMVLNLAYKRAGFGEIGYTL